MKTGSIYKLSDKRYIIFGQSKTVSGFRIASEPYFNITDSEANVQTIADSIKAALKNDDNKRVPDPKDWKQFGIDFLHRVGLKYMRELDNPANKYVSIGEDEMQLIFTPSQPAKNPDKGFINLNNEAKIMVSTASSNQEIMEALQEAFSKCG